VRDSGPGGGAFVRGVSAEINLCTFIACSNLSREYFLGGCADSSVPGQVVQNGRFGP